MEAGEFNTHQASCIQRSVVIQKTLLDSPYAHGEVRFHGVFLRHARVRIYSGGDVYRHRTDGSATVAQVVHFHAKVRYFLVQQAGSPNAQQAVQKNHRLARNRKWCFLVFQQGR